MKNNLLKYYIAAFYLCSTFLMVAQDPGSDTATAGGLESTDAAAPAAPIDDYVWVLALVGLFFVFMKYRAMQNRRINN